MLRIFLNFFFFFIKSIDLVILPKVGSATKTIVLSSTFQKSLIANPDKKKKKVGTELHHLRVRKTLKAD